MRANCCTGVYTQSIQPMRCEYEDTEKVEGMGIFFSHGDVVVTGMLGGSTGRKPAQRESSSRPIHC